MPPPGRDPVRRSSFRPAWASRPRADQRAGVVAVRRTGYGERGDLPVQRRGGERLASTLAVPHRDQVLPSHSTRFDRYSTAREARRNMSRK